MALPGPLGGLTAEVRFSPNPADTTPGELFDQDDLISMRIFSQQFEYDVGKCAYGVKRHTPLTVKDVLTYVWGYAAGRY